MRKTVMVMMMCLLVAGCGESNVSVLGNPESQGVMVVRAGTEVVKNLEVGGSISYSPGDRSSTSSTTWSRNKRDNWTKTTTTQHEEDNDWTYGAHALLHFPDLVPYVTPYAGGQVNIGNGTWDIDDTIQPIGGVSVGPAFAEYQHKSLNGEKDKVMFGVRFKF